jgi:hypothetical protein
MGGMYWYHVVVAVALSSFMRVHLIAAPCRRACMRVGERAGLRRTARPAPPPPVPPRAAARPVTRAFLHARDMHAGAARPLVGAARHQPPLRPAWPGSRGGCVVCGCMSIIWHWQPPSHSCLGLHGGPRRASNANLGHRMYAAPVRVLCEWWTAPGHWIKLARGGAAHYCSWPSVGGWLASGHHPQTGAARRGSDAGRQCPSIDGCTERV